MPLLSDRRPDYQDTAPRPSEIAAIAISSPSPTERHVRADQPDEASTEIACTAGAEWREA